MIVYRVPPYPLYVEIKGMTALESYDYVLNDVNLSPVSTGTVVADGDGTLRVQIPSARYDAEYSLEVYDDDGNQLVDQPFFVVKPYLDMSKLSGTPAQKEKQEVIARGIIDSVTGGFGYTKQVYEVEGSGSDYLPVPFQINKLLRVWESGVLVYDVMESQNERNYEVSKDRSSIVLSETEDRNSSSPIRHPRAYSDYMGSWGGRSGEFPNGVDYVIEFETGFSSIPQSVVQAAHMLASDVACGSDYLNRYILEYNTDQYKVRFSARALSGTGNKVVDQLLSGYSQYMIRAGLI